MKYCKKCVMPDTRPGITFNDEGVCSACVNYEKRKHIDYDKRHEEMVALCNKYRKNPGEGYDCIIAASGGKDSHFQTYYMKEKMNMNPLLVSVFDNFTMTEAGKSNIRNISQEFGCDIIALHPNIKAQKHIMRKTFEKYAKPTWYIDRLIYTYPLQMALKLNIPLVVYGENVSFEYGGNFAEETCSAKDQLKNGVASDIDFNELIDENISLNDLYLCNAPTEQQLDALEPIYLSYFTEWNSHANYLFAKKRGFKDLSGEWNREGFIENYDQIDSVGYLVHAWLKYPKFGHRGATDYASRYVRYGYMTRDEAIELVRKNDKPLDQKMLNDFLDFTGYSHKEFWSIVDKFYNTEIFEKDRFGNWELKEPIYDKNRKLNT